MVTAAARQRSGRSSVHLDGDDDAFATPAVGDMSGQRSRFNLFSGTARAVISASLALCCILTGAYCYRARRRTISNTRRRFLLGMRDLDLVPGIVRGADDPPSPSPHDVAGRTANLDDAPPSPPAVRFGTARPLGAPPHPDVARHANPGTVAGWTARPAARYATMGHGTDRPAEFPTVPRATPSPAGPRSARPTAGSEPPFPAGRRASFGPGDCPVCLESLHGGDDLKAAHACGHVFHAPCIDQWLAQRDFCPVCRCRVLCGDEAAQVHVGDHDLAQEIVVERRQQQPAFSADCPVCLEALHGGGDVKAVHACGHVFHSHCIDQWIGRRNSCPVCRCTVRCRRDRANEAALGGGHLQELVGVVISATREEGQRPREEEAQDTGTRRRRVMTMRYRDRMMQ